MIIEVWYSPEYASWAVSRFDADGTPSDIESEWHHAKSQAERSAIETANREGLAAFSFTKDFSKKRELSLLKGSNS